ncbi:AraC family transcriptional regulator [Flavobacterium sp. Root420]|uniref:helix-turn-helix domain-containing protein n=1 Tax=Flavobacterium sp. Root420 TaxID=1736533 RepID=UPI001F52AF86|nr:hypothetical protein [Flavobacterium sp. Root420]
MLINYYKTTNNPKLQLYYIEQLLKADTVLNETFKYLVGKINKEYNTQELLIEKEKLKKQLLKKNQNYTALIVFTSILFTGFILLTYRYFKKRRFYKQKFDELTLKNGHVRDKTKPKLRAEQPVILDINPETISIILKQLDKFENDQKFLEKDWSLSKLSIALNSNPTYLSSIIHHYKEKRFSDYINDLKIDYIIELLYSDKRARNFTNKALAQEAGFSSTQRFANAFKAKTEMPTAYFIGQIKKEK